MSVARKMRKQENVLQREKYSNDVMEAVMANIKKTFRQRQQMSIWGSDNVLLDSENSVDSAQTEHQEMAKYRNVSTLPQEISKGDYKSIQREMGIPHIYEYNRRPPKSFSPKKDMNLLSVEHKNYPTEEDNENIPQKTITYGLQSNEPVNQEISVAANENTFSDWCSKRKNEFSPKSSKVFSLEPPPAIIQPKIKRNRLKSKSPETENRKSRSSVDKIYAKSMNELRVPRDVVKSQVCIKISDDRNDKNQEFTMDISDLSRIKRNFPKLKEILPEVDSEKKTTQFSMDAVNFILRFIFFRRYNKEAMPGAAVGVEILAASKAWEINAFYDIFFKDFSEKTLSLSNVNLVFSHASHYGLNDVCDFCKEVAVDGISIPSSTYHKKQKTCLISVSTYIEPLEFPIPFQSIEENFQLSFEKHISNTVKFEAISGSFTIIGIYLQLNSDYLEKCCNLNMLEIDYTTRNISEDKEIEMGRCEKPVRPINVIHFRKHLVVNPNQTVEIMVETDTKPYLCSVFPKNKMLKEQAKNGEFCVKVDSDVKLSKSGENICIIGKLLYNLNV